MPIISMRNLDQELIDRGIVPKDCRKVELVFEPGSVSYMRYERYLTDETMLAVAEALTAIASDKSNAAKPVIEK